MVSQYRARELINLGKRRSLPSKRPPCHCRRFDTATNAQVSHTILQSSTMSAHACSISRRWSAYSARL
jgi:hypothetical protein